MLKGEPPYRGAGGRWKQPDGRLVHEPHGASPRMDWDDSRYLPMGSWSGLVPSSDDEPSPEPPDNWPSASGSSGSQSSGGQ
jgi:hypothetical protein